MRVPILLLFFVGLSSPTRAAPSADERARARYEEGVRQFEAGDKEGALIEFQFAQEIAPRIENLFMMAQCEYHMGRLVEARDHYRAYIAERSSGEFAELARLRIDTIDRRPGRLVINAEPDEVEVRIEGEGRTFSSQGSNNFDVPRGRYRIQASKPNYRPETRQVAIDVGQTQWLSFKLDPIPARLEIRTDPPGATLYVRGNRARNPYVQDVEPGSYEVYAEATNYDARNDVIVLAPGERRSFELTLRYVQRSGRPEIISFWTVAGAIAGGTAVLARLERLDNPASGTLVAAGALAGGTTGAVISAALTPSYIPDNLAMFQIGAAAVGAIEGASIGIVSAGDLSTSAAWIGGASGLVLGAVGGAVFDDHAPNYGRVALMQSAAAWGTLAGALAVPALSVKTSDYSHYVPIGVLAGLNLGLGAGLAMAYLPDQRKYGPTWQRVVLIDLAGAAGAFLGALATTVDKCLAPDAAPGNCRFASDRPTAAFALGGAAVGLTAGWLLTRSFDKGNDAPSERAPAATALIPVPTALPVQLGDGRVRVLPGLAAQGRF